MMFFDFADIIFMIVGCDSCDPFILSWSTFLEPQYIGTEQLEQFRSSILLAGKGGTEKNRRLSNDLIPGPSLRLILLKRVKHERISDAFLDSFYSTQIATILGVQ